MTEFANKENMLIAYICVRLFSKKHTPLVVICIDLLQTKYLSWLLNTLPNFFHLDSISIIFMLPKPKIWKIRVYGPISEIFWDLILPRWIIRIVFYKIVCHIIFRKIFAYLNMSNSGLFSFTFFVTDQTEITTQVSMWLKRWTGNRTKECEIRIHG